LIERGGDMSLDTVSAGQFLVDCMAGSSLPQLT
jgi:hypothetical protein